MNVEITDQTDRWYSQAEHKAAQYFTSLYTQVKDKSYVPVLSEDFQLWKKNHIHPWWLSCLSRSKKKPDTKDYVRYIRWMEQTGKLEEYLDRSVSYIYMRDLGKALDSPHTQSRIQRKVTSLKNRLNRYSDATVQGLPEFTSLDRVYRWAQKEGTEDAVIWVINKLKKVSRHIPKDMNAEHAKRKLIKIIIGVVMHVSEEMEDDILPTERSARLDAAIRLGYSYGLTYPYIDDLLDSQVLNAQEKDRYSAMIRTSLLTRTVPEIDEWEGDHEELIQYIHGELREAFEYIQSCQRPEALDTFFEQSYVFFQSQDIDRRKDLSNPHYSNEELFLPVILKSSSSRLIVRSVISAPEDEGFEQRTFYYGIYNQLADDFADMFDDMKAGAVTPYTYYLKYHKQRKDLLNPYEMYWAVIHHLIHHVYHGNAKAREVILDRAINGLKRCKQRVGMEQYKEIMDLFASGQPQFNRLIQHMVDKADNVDFFDKLLRDQMINSLRQDREEKEWFTETIRTVRDKINDQLLIPPTEALPPMMQTLIEAANYSLKGDGKRLRPIITWFMGMNEYQLQPETIMPLLKSIEYMHTASLIFDDLPSQDNASTRRGRPTLHHVYSSGTAELTGLYLMQKATEEQASLDRFDPKTVLAMMRYSSQKAAEMCMGQEMDLSTEGTVLTLEQLNMLCFYKTGNAFEASLVMPAILAKADEEELTTLKKYAYHAGIAFQIKDDLLDAEGNDELLGKPTGQDELNNKSTFVTVLGTDGARRHMWDHYCLAMEELGKYPGQFTFLKHLLDYLINRDH